VVDIVRRLAEEGALDADGVAPTMRDVSPPSSRRQETESAAERDADALAAERELREEEARAEEAPEEEEAGANAEEQEQIKEDVEKDARNEADYRRIYMDLYAETPRDFRVKAASEVSGAELLALCFDPDPQIIHAL